MRVDLAKVENILSMHKLRATCNENGETYTAVLYAVNSPEQFGKSLIEFCSLCVVCAEILVDQISDESLSFAISHILLSHDLIIVRAVLFA